MPQEVTFEPIEIGGIVRETKGSNGLLYRAVPVPEVKSLDVGEGIVEAIVSVTGIEDNVKDIILPGAYTKTLQRRKPKGVWNHSWNDWVAKTLSVAELMPGNDRLPMEVKGLGGGALHVVMQFNLKTQAGRDAYENVKFFEDECEFSIGYQVPPGSASYDTKSGVRSIRELDLYEYSPVLFGAMSLTHTLSVKSMFADMQSKHGHPGQPGYHLLHPDSHTKIPDGKGKAPKALAADLRDHGKLNPDGTVKEGAKPLSHAEAAALPHRAPKAGGLPKGVTLDKVEGRTGEQVTRDGKAVGHVGEFNGKWRSIRPGENGGQAEIKDHGSKDEAIHHLLGSGGGKATKPARIIDGKLVPEGADASKPVQVRTVSAAVRELDAGHAVELRQPRQVSTLLDRLNKIVKDAEARGDKAPTYDLCKVSVKGSNLFCADSKGIPRLKMPQLGGVPTKGSKADKLPRDVRGEVHLDSQFRDYLKGKGVGIEDTTEKASYLKASQNELNGVKVAGIAKAMRDGVKIDGSLFTSRDNYIVDGHHRWAATIGVDMDDNHPGDLTMPIARIDMDILSLLAEANKFAAEWGIPQAGLSTGFGNTKDGFVAIEAADLAAMAELKASVEAKHGDPSDPGYRLLHPNLTRGHLRDDIRKNVEAMGRALDRNEFTLNEAMDTYDRMDRLWKHYGFPGELPKPAYTAEHLPVHVPWNPDSPTGSWPKGSKTLSDALAFLEEAEKMMTEEKRQFSKDERDKAADEGHALPDGSFPIKTAEDVKNAVALAGKAKDPAKAKAHIKRRAKALDAEHHLPDDWRASGKAAVDVDDPNLSDDGIEEGEGDDIDSPDVCPRCHTNMVGDDGEVADRCPKCGWTAEPVDEDDLSTKGLEPECDDDCTDCADCLQRKALEVVQRAAEAGDADAAALLQSKVWTDAQASIPRDGGQWSAGSGSSGGTDKGKTSGYKPKTDEGKQVRQALNAEAARLKLAGAAVQKVIDAAAKEIDNAGGRVHSGSYVSSVVDAAKKKLAAAKGNAAGRRQAAAPAAPIPGGTATRAAAKSLRVLEADLTADDMIDVADPEDFEPDGEVTVELKSLTPGWRITVKDAAGDLHPLASETGTKSALDGDDEVSIEVRCSTPGVKVALLGMDGTRIDLPEGAENADDLADRGQARDQAGGGDDDLDEQETKRSHLAQQLAGNDDQASRALAGAAAEQVTARQAGAGAEDDTEDDEGLDVDDLLEDDDRELLADLDIDPAESKAATMVHESLDRSPKKNWVERSGQLPAYIQHIAKDLHEEQGMTLSRAIATAIAAVKRWAVGGGKVNPDTRAKAAAAVAEWEALKAKNKARKAGKAVARAASAAASSDSSKGLDQHVDLDVKTVLQDALEAESDPAKAERLRDALLALDEEADDGFTVADAILDGDGDDANGQVSEGGEPADETKAVLPLGELMEFQALAMSVKSPTSR